MLVNSVSQHETLVPGEMYVFYYDGNKKAGKFKPGKGNEEEYPSFDVNGKLYSVKRNDVVQKILGLENNAEA